MLITVLATAARAQDVTFDLDQQKASSLGLDTADLEAQLGGAIDDQLNLTDPSTYLANYANAAAMSTKGMGVDYASNPKKFSAGFSLGSAVSGVPISFSRGPENLPEGGYAFMAALHAGVNLGVFTPGDKGALDHVRIYVSGLGFEPPASREFQAAMYNVGAHAQIKLFGLLDGAPVEWGGIDLTGGYERSWYKLGLSQGLPISQDMSGATVTWTAEGTYDISATADTIPLELSTNLRVLVVTGWIGGGVDLVTGSAESTAALSGPVSASAQGLTEDLGSASVSLGGLGDADVQVPRIFVGAQANILILKVYGQLNVGLNETYGGFVGFRLAM